MTVNLQLRFLSTGGENAYRNTIRKKWHTPFLHKGNKRAARADNTTKETRKTKSNKIKKTITKK